ncbi:unnamed protein product [Rotaria sordida]|uniref:NAD(P)(+)--arginine ADP-ribosyltransferase n=1 Tax=Rotaria sordida TaxID=392033 RepID=A0A815DPH2_9BILA|nr:unnamed protein product [Rotaria sordida]
MTIRIIFIWYDINIIKDDVYNQCNDILFTFHHDQQSCIDFIKSTPKSETIFFVSSASYVGEILPLINDFRQLNSIFIYSIDQEHKVGENMFDKYSKIIGIFDKFEDLFQSIHDHIDLVNKQIETFKFYEKHQKSTRQLSKEFGSFLWLRLFKDVILQLPHDEQAKQEIIEKLKEYNRNNNKQMRLIENFDQTYKSEDALLWYTKESFLYNHLNKALRTEDIEFLYKFRYFISDLSKNLLCEYEQLKESLDSIVTYRGVQISKDEAKNLESSVGKLISTNGYLSTSFEKSIALTFITESREEKERILFEIECDLHNTDSIILAPIAHYSNNPSEEEVLFDLDAAFEILSVSRDLLSNIVVVKMKTTDEGSILAQQYIKQHRRYINTSSAKLIYGRLLSEIGQYDKCQQYFEHLLENPNGEDLSFIYYYLGMSEFNKGNYENALEYYKHSYDMLLITEIPRVGSSACVLNDIGSILSIRGQYDQALDYYIRALKISQDHSNYPMIAVSLGSIGIIYRIKGEYHRALDYQMRCLDMKEKYLPNEHREIARTSDHIATVFNDLGDFVNAMKYHQKSLKMNEKCLPIGHDSIGSSFNHLAHVLTNQGKYDEALDYYIASLKNKENVFPNGHISIVKILSKIGYIYYLKKDYNFAFDYLEKSMKMRENLFSDIHDVNLLSTLTYFGLVLIKQHKYDDALIYSKRAFDLAKILLPIGHEDMTDCLTNIGIIYREMGNYSEAFEYFKKAHENEDVNPTKPSFIRLARNYDNMGMCLYQQGNDETGLKYRMKAVRLIEQASPRTQHADWIDTIGNIFLEKKIFDEALECYLISLNMKLECLPANHVDIADSLMFLGDVYVEKANLEHKQCKLKARSYYEQALIIYQKLDHYNTIYILNAIGDIYEKMHKYRLAILYYRKALEMCEKYSSADKSVRERIENNMARIQWLMN